MTLLSAVHSPTLTLCQTGVSLLLSVVALLSPYWCQGKQKMPKPLCTLLKTTDCIPVPGLPNSSNSSQLSWEIGEERFTFPSFHSGLWTSCQENIYLDKWEEKCFSFIALTPPSEKVMLWLSVTLELTYISLLGTSSVLLGLQLCTRSWLPSAARWGLLCNAFAAIFTVLGGLLGMVGHMMFMQVFQVTASKGQDDFKPHKYGYSWAFYVAWAAFSVSMSSGVTTLNNYTKDILMRRQRCTQLVHLDATTKRLVQLPKAPFYCPPPPTFPPPSPPLSHPSPSSQYSPLTDSTIPTLASPSSDYFRPNMPSPSLSQSHSDLIYVLQYSNDCDSL